MKTARRILFALAVTTLPAPLLVFQPALAPPLRYAILAAAASALALREGAEGAVPLIIAMLWTHALAYAAACWLLAWGLARALAPLSPVRRRLAVMCAVAAVLAAALALPVYRTPMGSAPVGNLIGALS